MKSFSKWVLLASLSGPLLPAQTLIDLRTQTKSVDFSSAVSTKPSKVGAVLPSTCSVGETFFQTGVAAGRNHFGCTSLNIWTLLGGNLSFGGGAVSTDDCAKFNSAGNVVSAGAPCGTGAATAITMAAPFTSAGSLLISTGAGRQGAAGLCSETAGALTCPGGFGGQRTGWFGGTGATSRQILGPVGAFSANFNYRWTDTVPTAATLMKIGAPASGESSLGPALPETDYVTPSGSGFLQYKGLDSTNTMTSFLSWVQIAKPSAPAAGYLRVYAKTGSGLCWINSAGAESCAGAGALPDPGSTGFLSETSPGVLANRTLSAGSSNITVTNGSGTAGNPTIDVGSVVDFSGKITSPVQVGSASAMPGTCSTGQLYFASDGVNGRKLQTCSLTNTWTPAGYDQGAAVPGTCSVGQIFFHTAASAGRNLHFCGSTNVWTQMHGEVTSAFGRTGAVAAQTGDYSYAQIANTPAAMPPNGAASGDLGGSYPSPTVTQVNGAAIPAGGLLKANSSHQIVAAVSGTDFSPATSGSSVLKANSSGGFAPAIGGSDFELPLTFSGSLNRTGNTVTCTAASGIAAGCLSNTDWTTFSNKQNALTNPITGTGVTGSIAKFTASGSIGAAAPGTDYAPATVSTAPLKGNGSGGFSNTTAADVINLFGGCSGTQYLGADGNCHASSGSGTGNVVLTTGAGAPAAACTAPSSTNLAVYADTTNGDQWWCSATNSWKKLLSVTGSGPYRVTGLEGTAPGTPASGYVSCYFSSVTHTQVCLDSSATASLMVKPDAGATHNFLTGVTSAGAISKAQPAVADLSDGGNLTRTIASGTISLPTTAVSSAACSSAITATATGVASTDVVALTANADPTSVTGYTPATSGSLYIWAWLTSNTLNVKLCNNTSASITPASAVILNFRVTR